MGWKTKAKYAQMRAALIEVLRNKGHFHYRPPTETPSAAEFEAALIAEGHRIQKTGRKGLALIAQAMGVVVVPVDGQRVALAKPKLKPAVPKKAPASSDFLETYEWRRLRMEALKRGLMWSTFITAPHSGVRGGNERRPHQAPLALSRTGSGSDEPAGAVRRLQPRERELGSDGLAGLAHRDRYNGPTGQVNEQANHGSVLAVADATDGQGDPDSSGG